jgi:hypothetical protein
MSGELPDIGRFAAAFEEFLEAMTAAAHAPESGLATRIRDHLGTDPREVPSTTARFPPRDHPNVQLALDAVAPDADVLGYEAPQQAVMMGISLSELLAGRGAGGAVTPGPVQYADVEVGDGRIVACVANGVYLARHDGAPLAAVVSRIERPYGAAIRLECVSPQREAGAAWLAAVRAAMREHNVFRGKVISLHQRDDRSVYVRFHTLPPVARDGVILPEGTLERLEAHASGIARHAERLRAAGRHLKRGVLLHGPPGTGKTLSVSYLLGAMPGRTTILLTGNGLGLIEQAVSMARELAPATVVFEDVDLVATERTMRTGAGSPLFDLLNQMEGVDEDADLLFLLTTNRPDVVEPALAARPGRVDLALEIPLPDAAARARLVDLYAQGIDLDDAAREQLVTRTDAVSGAFIRELMRQAELHATLGGRAAAADDVLGALDELLEDRSLLTRRLLGQAAEAPMRHALAAAGLPVPPDRAAE